MKQNIAILALLGYMTGAEALRYDKSDAGKDFNSIRGDITEIKNKLNRVETWYKNSQNKTQDNKTDDNKTDDNKQEDNKKDDNKQDDSTDNWVTQQKLDKGCDAGYKRFMHEGRGRIKVAEGSLFEDISFPAEANSIKWGST